MGVVPVYVLHMLRGQFGRKVDVLQAVCGNAYRRGFFNTTALEVRVSSLSHARSCRAADQCCTV